METSRRHAQAMPWKEQDAVNQREAFVRAYLKRHVSMAELCREFSISRKTGYKWTQRFLEGGLPNLLDRSSTPHRLRHAIERELVGLLVDVRSRFPSWGPKKLCAFLDREKPEMELPA